jgi:hypothetical protein
MTYGVTALADISADDYELAEAALAATDTKPEDLAALKASPAPAMRMLRDECGWTVGKAKCVLDLIALGYGSRGRKV